MAAKGYYATFQQNHAELVKKGDAVPPQYFEKAKLVQEVYKSILDQAKKFCPYIVLPGEIDNSQEPQPGTSASFANNDQSNVDEEAADNDNLQFQENPADMTYNDGQQAGEGAVSWGPTGRNG